MNHRLRQGMLVAALIVPAVVAAQDAATPQTLLIGREIVKPGKVGAHAKLETAWARALEAAKYPGTFLAMNSMSGANEVWFLSSFGSMAEMQKLNDAYDASPVLSAVGDKYSPAESDLLANGFQMITSRRNDLSYSSGTPLTAFRYLTVQRMAVKIGHNAEFVEARKLIKVAHEQAKLSDGFAIYQVNDGAPAGTFLIMRGLKSLAELDTNPHNATYVTALGGADGQKKLSDLAASYTNSSDVTLFQFSPSMSSLSKAWSDADPFWKPKTAAKKAQ